MYYNARQKTGALSSCYDKDDLEHINCVKFDMLGLKTESEMLTMKKLTGYEPTEKDIESEEVLESFRKGNTDGVFQMEKVHLKRYLT